MIGSTINDNLTLSNICCTSTLIPHLENLEKELKNWRNQRHIAEHQIHLDVHTMHQEMDNIHNNIKRLKSYRIKIDTKISSRMDALCQVQQRLSHIFAPEASVLKMLKNETTSKTKHDIQTTFHEGEHVELDQKIITTPTSKNQHRRVEHATLTKQADITLTFLKKMANKDDTIKELQEQLNTLEKEKTTWAKRMQAAEIDCKRNQVLLSQFDIEQQKHQEEVDVLNVEHVLALEGINNENTELKELIANANLKEASSKLKQTKSIALLSELHTENVETKSMHAKEMKLMQDRCDVLESERDSQANERNDSDQMFNSTISTLRKQKETLIKNNQSLREKIQAEQDAAALKEKNYVETIKTLEMVVEKAEEVAGRNFVETVETVETVVVRKAVEAKDVEEAKEKVKKEEVEEAVEAVKPVEESPAELTSNEQLKTISDIYMERDEDETVVEAPSEEQDLVVLFQSIVVANNSNKKSGHTRNNNDTTSQTSNHATVIFKLLDDDGSGEIEKSEFKKMLKKNDELAKMFFKYSSTCVGEEEVTGKNIKKLFAEIDTTTDSNSRGKRALTIKEITDWCVKTGAVYN